MATKHKILLGRRFGRLVVTKRAPFRKRRHSLHAMWHCRCDCGGKSIVYQSALDTSPTNRSATRSCGCTHRRKGKDNPIYIHGGYEGEFAYEYTSYRAMMGRCYCPGHTSYERYHANGTTVCDRWREPNGKGFFNFFADMGRRPQGTTLDRENVMGNYEPGNCRWATAKTQANNKRRNYTEEELVELKKQAQSLMCDPLEAETMCA